MKALRIKMTLDDLVDRIVKETKTQPTEVARQDRSANRLYGTVKTCLSVHDMNIRLNIKALIRDYIEQDSYLSPKA